MTILMKDNECETLNALRAVGIKKAFDIGLAKLELSEGELKVLYDNNIIQLADLVRFSQKDLISRLGALERVLWVR